jgi:hypothetical protein
VIPVGNIKFPVSDVGGAIGFAILTIAVVAAAKRLPVVKSLV